MKKGYKIKHYNSRIYNPIRGKILRAVLIVVIAASLFAIGWFLYEPLMKSVNNANKEIIEQNPVEVPEKEKLPEAPPPEFTEKETLAVTVPTDILYRTEAYYNFLCDLDDSVTAVVLEMKTASGEVTYRSAQTSVKNVETTSPSAVDLSQRIQSARNLGFDVIAQIYAFEDASAPYHSADMAIRYETEDGVLWLDDSVDAGGKPWLNPYSNTAQKYVLDIIYDALDAGVDAVLLDGLRFPGESGLSYAYFGTALSATKNEILKQFSDRVYAAAVTSETDVILAYDGMALLSGTDDIYGGSPLGFSCDAFAPHLDFKALIGEKYPTFHFKTVPEDLSEVASAVYTVLGNQPNARFLPILACEGNEKAQNKALQAVFAEHGAMGSVLIYDDIYFRGAPVTPVLPEAEEPTPSAPSKPAKPSTPSAPTTPTTPTTPTPTTPTTPAETPETPSTPTRPSSGSAYRDEDGVWHL